MCLALPFEYNRARLIYFCSCRYMYMYYQDIQEVHSHFSLQIGRSVVSRAATTLRHEADFRRIAD